MYVGGIYLCKTKGNILVGYAHDTPTGARIKWYGISAHESAWGASWRLGDWELFAHNGRIIYEHIGDAW